MIQLVKEQHLINGIGTDIGSAIPDSVGWFLSDPIMEGSTVYYYVTVDISETASLGNIFNVGLTSPDPLDSYGVSDANKINESFISGNAFTIGTVALCNCNTTEWR